jgi:hypothetical protein
LRDFSLHKLNEPQKFFRLRQAEKKHILKKNSFKLIPDTVPLLGLKISACSKLEKVYFQKIISNFFQIVARPLLEPQNFYACGGQKGCFLKNNFNRF